MSKGNLGESAVVVPDDVAAAAAVVVAPAAGSNSSSSIYYDENQYQQQQKKKRGGGAGGGGGGGGTLAEGMKSMVRETLFPDNPLRGFRKQTPKHRFYMALAYIFPPLQWGCGYTLLTFKDDLLAGLTIGSLSIPQGIAYAKLAGLPPIYGLCKPFSFLPFFLSRSNPSLTLLQQQQQQIHTYIHIPHVDS